MNRVRIQYLAFFILFCLMELQAIINPLIPIRSADANGLPVVQMVGFANGLGRALVIALSYLAAAVMLIGFMEKRKA